MTDEERLAAAFAFAAQKHSGQLRKGGEPYITHPAAVAQWLKERGFDTDTQITGLFHDLLEDTDATEKEILALSDERVLKAVKLLTKTKGYVMADYVAGIMTDETAKAVKTADRIHNLRSAVTCDEDFRRRYIAESRQWFLGLSPEVGEAADALEKTLEPPSGDQIKNNNQE